MASTDMPPRSHLLASSPCAARRPNLHRQSRPASPSLPRARWRRRRHASVSENLRLSRLQPHASVSENLRLSRLQPHAGSGDTQKPAAMALLSQALPACSRAPCRSRPVTRLRPSSHYLEPRRHHPSSPHASSSPFCSIRVRRMGVGGGHGVQQQLRG